MKIKTAAKVNLALDVCGKLPNGYHVIKSVFQTVGIYDEVTVELNNSGNIDVNCILTDEFDRADHVPGGEKNIAYKAARLFLDTIGSDKGCGIVIKKGIPSQAGMGGGSSDAAAVIYCLNELCSARIDIQKLVEIGKKIGADVPFFFTGGTAYVSGIGEKITSLPDYSGRILVVAKGVQGISTAEAYKAVDRLEAPNRPNIESLSKAIAETPECAHRFFGNIFEDAAALEEVSQIRRIMKASGALSAVMTGSGSAVFGLFTDMDNAKKCRDILKKQEFFSGVCLTTDKAFINCE